MFCSRRLCLKLICASRFPCRDWTASSAPHWSSFRMICCGCKAHILGRGTRRPDSISWKQSTWLGRLGRTLRSTLSEWLPSSILLERPGIEPNSWNTYPSASCKHGFAYFSSACQRILKELLSSCDGHGVCWPITFLSYSRRRSRRCRRSNAWRLIPECTFRQSLSWEFWRPQFLLSSAFKTFYRAWQ